MSVGPMGVVGSIAGSLPQMRSAEAGKTEKQITDQSRQIKSDQKAEAAEGIGETAQDEKTSDRDADGQRLWEAAPEGHSNSEDSSEQKREPEERRSIDPTGSSGGAIDLSG
jgi:hypothetical protein